MIIVRLIGGLGNQLFQYALGKRLSLDHGVPLLLDVTGFEEYKLHRYSLAAFNIEERLMPASMLTSVRRAATPSRPRQALASFMRPFNPTGWPRYVKEQGFHFNPGALVQRPPLYLDGFWQSEKYFAPIADRIRTEFTVKTPQAGRDAEIAAQIADCESVALHIRRADYVSNPATRDFHGGCDSSYYAKAVEALKADHPDLRCFVFSDDQPWCRENLKIPAPAVFVDHNGADRNYEDLRLMSQCRHNIIANSTFSWWGAWLNPNPGKRVFAPSRWFNDPSSDTRDVYPAGWTLL